MLIINHQNMPSASKISNRHHQPLHDLLDLMEDGGKSWEMSRVN